MSFYSSYRKCQPVSGHPICIATWIGSDPSLQSVCLNSHVDVVPADLVLLIPSKVIKVLELIVPFASLSGALTRGAASLKTMDRSLAAARKYVHYCASSLFLFSSARLPQDMKR